MEQNNSIPFLMGMIDRPAFCVRDGFVLTANNAAIQLGIQPQMSVSPLLGGSAEAYAAFTGGTLSCTLLLCDVAQNVSITKVDGIDYFVLDKAEDPVLSSLALAAQQLRKPLSGLMALMDSEYMLNAANSAKGATPVSQINKSLLQIHRQICNMSDAAFYAQGSLSMSTVGIRSLFAQIMEKVSVLMKHSGFRLHFELPEEEVYTDACAILLERAVYNLISNAVKFASKEADIRATLEMSEDMIRFSVQSAAATENSRPNFDMYTRQPGLEDSRLGLGLGLVLVRQAAVHHGGTVLIDKSKDGSTRITMTLAVRNEDKPTLRSPSAQYVDYSGGIDHALLELSDVLSCDCYRA